MLHIRKALCVLFTALLLVQPAFAETEPPTTPEPDIVTAVHTMQTLPSNFSPLTPQTEEKLWLRALTTAPLYAMNADGSWNAVLAAALPEDVTEDYVNSYGIPADAQRGYAFRITLRSDACWEDGTPITADDVLFSVQKLFESEETSDDWLFLANAAAIRSGKLQPGSDIVSLKDAGFSNVSEAWAAGYTEFYLDTEGYWGLGSGWKSVSDRTRLRDFAMPAGLDELFVTPAYLYRYYLMDGSINNYYQSQFIGICRTPGDALTVNDLGLVKVSDQELILLLQDPLAASTLMQKLEGLFLFRQELWSENYGDGTAHYLSYGPYRIASASYEQILLVPNPNWFGEADPRGYDRILCRKIGT